MFRSSSYKPLLDLLISFVDINEYTAEFMALLFVKEIYLTTNLNKSVSLLGNGNIVAEIRI